MLIKMNLISSTYWLLQLLWWLFSTFYLHRPTTMYFQKNPQKLNEYLLLSFSIGLLFTATYKFIHQKKQPQEYPLLTPFFGILLLGIGYNLLDFGFDFYRYSKPNYNIALDIYDYFRFFVESIRYSLIWFLFYHLWYNTQLVDQREVDLAKSDTALKSAELINLRNQLNPHFLFNALNSIKALTLTEPHRARTSITQLSDLLRSSLTFSNQLLVSIEDELKLVKQYLAIEKIRFNERLSYKVDISDQILTERIPPMSLQLLVENAIKHGISRNKNGGEIIITGQKEGNVCILEVKNTGKLSGKEPDIGLGIDNLKKRLAFRFGEKASFSLIEENDWVRAIINIENK
jgi:two-component system, LytTR family, sensor kinase